LKIENFNKVSKNKPKLPKEKVNKPTKTIINIPNAKFKKNTTSEYNNNIPAINDLNLLNNNKELNNKNNGFNESSIINNVNNNNSQNNNKIIIDIPKKKFNENPNDVDDDTNEGIPVEYSGLVNMPYKSTKNNDLKDINNRCMRLNTDDNTYGLNEHFYSNMKVSPIKEHAMKFRNVNNNNNNINSKKYLIIIYKIL